MMEPSPNCNVINVRRKSYIPGPMFGLFSFINVKEVLNPENDMKNIVEIAVVFQILQLLYKGMYAYMYVTM